MPNVIHQSQPMFRVHDQHPMLRGLAVLLAAALFLAVFFLSVMPGVLDR
jgi:hypothetical protein